MEIFLKTFSNQTFLYYYKTTHALPHRLTINKTVLRALTENELNMLSSLINKVDYILNPNI